MWTASIPLSRLSRHMIWWVTSCMVWTISLISNLIYVKTLIGSKQCLTTKSISMDWIHNQVSQTFRIQKRHTTLFSTCSKKSIAITTWADLRSVISVKVIITFVKMKKDQRTACSLRVWPQTLKARRCRITRTYQKTISALWKRKSSAIACMKIMMMNNHQGVSWAVWPGEKCVI